MNPIFELLRADGSISLNKALVHAIGLHEAIMYCELISRNSYFQDRGELTEDGYFFNTVRDLQAGTSLSRKQQKNAIDNLEELKLVYTKLQGMPAKRYFKIAENLNLLGKYLEQGKGLMKELKDYKKAEKAPEIKYGKNGRTSTAKMAVQVRQNVPPNNTKDNNTKKGLKDAAQKPAACEQPFLYTGKDEKQEQKEKAAPGRAADTVNTSKTSLSGVNDKSKPELYQALDLYKDLFREATGEEAHIKRGQDHKLLKDIISSRGINETLELLEVYFREADSFTRDKQGYSIGYFSKSINRLITLKAKGSGGKEYPKAWDNLKEWLMENGQDSAGVKEYDPERYDPETNTYYTMGAV